MLLQVQQRCLAQTEREKKKKRARYFGNLILEKLYIDQKTASLKNGRTCGQICLIETSELAERLR